jgi:serine/threonine protein kinase
MTPKVDGVTDLEEIGRGGFGVVYRARETELHRSVAVKVLSASLNESDRNRFDRERKAMGVLSSHPHIVPIYRTGFTDDDQPYIVMEYLPKGSLRNRLTDAGPMDWREVMTIAVHLSGAIETAHREGVLHRDIKPGNIFMSALDEAKLGDFGIARIQGGSETKSASITASLAHAPPEVIGGRRPDARCDIYSLASTVYELLAGTPPFHRDDEDSLVPMLARIATDDVPPLAVDGIPQEFEDVLAAAMAKDPDDRFANAAAFGQALVDTQRQLGLPADRIRVEGRADVLPLIPPAPAPITTTVEPRTVTDTDPSVAVYPAAAPPPEPPTLQAQAPPPPAPTRPTAPPPPSTTSTRSPFGSHQQTSAAPPAPSQAPPATPVPAASSKSRGPGRWVIAGLSALALVAIAMVGLVLANSGNDNSPSTTEEALDATTAPTGSTTPSPTTGPSATTAPSPTTASAPTTAPAPTSGPPVTEEENGGGVDQAGVPDGYERIADLTNTLTITVPDRWDSRVVNKTLLAGGDTLDPTIPYAAMGVSTDFTALLDSDSYDFPGMLVSAEVFPSREVSLEELLDLSVDSMPCEVGPERSALDEPALGLEGFVDFYFNCGTDGNAIASRSLQILTDDPDVIVGIVTVSLEDADVADLFLARGTLDIDTEALRESVE